MGLSSLTSSWEGVNPEKPSNPFILACFDLLLCSPWSQLLLLNHNGHLDMLQPLMLPILLHTLPQLPTPTLMLLVSHMVFTILANVKLKLTLNTSTTLLPLQLFTTMLTTEYITESTMDFTRPMLVSTILASVMPKLTPNPFIVLEYITMDTTDTFQRSITLLLLR